MSAKTLDLVLKGDAKKGDVLGAARIAGIMAAKKTHELIPLCHPLALTKVEVDIAPDEKLPGLDRARDLQAQRPDRRRDGGAHRRLGRVPDDLRHGEGGRARHAHRGHSSGREARRQIGRLSREGSADMALLSGRRCARAACSKASSRCPPNRCRSPRPKAACSPRISRRGARSRREDVSAMDGYAVRAEDVASAPATADADRRGRGRPAVRRPRSSRARPRASSPAACCLRAATRSSSRRTPRARATPSWSTSGPARAATSASPGLDFGKGDVGLRKGRRLTGRDVALAAAMNHATVPVAPPAEDRHRGDRRRTGAARHRAGSRPDRLFQCVRARRRRAARRRRGDRSRHPARTGSRRRSRACAARATSAPTCC